MSTLLSCSRASQSRVAHFCKYWPMAIHTANSEGYPPKRQCFGLTEAVDIRTKRSAFLSSLSRTVSPPPSISPDCSKDTRSQKSSSISVFASNDPAMLIERSEAETALPTSEIRNSSKSICSPFKLTSVPGLLSRDNIDTVSLHDILGDPLIKEVWIFDFCFNVGWTMAHFDEDVRQLVDVKIVHGSWKNDDSNRIGIEEDLKKWRNVQEIRAYLPDPFGTHHSKMVILFKHDDTAQVVIHTANMLEVDWEHMTQAVWRSPVLPLEGMNQGEDNDRATVGKAFKMDLLRYLKAYGGKLKPLIDNLTRFDFSSVRAVLVASVPSYAKVSDPADKVWGHLALSRALDNMRQSRSRSTASQSEHLVCQVSSIATLPQNWLSETIHKAAQCKSSSIIFPTPTDMRNAVSGYATGGSIHTKASSPAHLKQIASLRPQLCRWGTRSSSSTTQAGRHSVPPHIKTFISFTSKPNSARPAPDIEWALLTSANLSTQAWGTAPKLPKGVRDPGQGVVHIQSFEIGVLVWPELFIDGDNANQKARMVPVFGKDKPEDRLADGDGQTIVGLRMPYDLPLTPYGANELPWSPSIAYTEPDQLGRLWPDRSW